MKIQNSINKILDILFILSIAIFFSSFGFTDSRTSSWYRQYLPNVNGCTFLGFTYIDSLVGFAVTTKNSSGYAYIMKTTDGGDNWTIKQTYYKPNSTTAFNGLQFVDNNVGYASINDSLFYKTTDSGENWFILNNHLYPDAIFAINKDTVFGVIYSGGSLGGVFRSINGGFNFQQIWTIPGGGSGNPSSIYMFDKNLGFTTNTMDVMRRTTDGGFNWTIIPNEKYAAIKFIDSLTGWKSYVGIKKTTDGGITWISQSTPPAIDYYYSTFSVLNKDTVWFVGAEKNPAPVFKTTNGGLNWGYQIPDTTHYWSYYFIQFVDIKKGWIKYGSSRAYRTLTGGNDTTFYTGLYSNTSEIPNNFELFQNYPNPFNQSTIINVQCAIKSHIKINVYDITGKEIITLINEEKSAGKYSIRFDARQVGSSTRQGGSSTLSSGIYFYDLVVNGKRLETKKMVLTK